MHILAAPQTQRICDNGNRLTRMENMYIMIILFGWTSRNGSTTLPKSSRHSRPRTGGMRNHCDLVSVQKVNTLHDKYSTLKVICVCSKEHPSCFLPSLVPKMHQIPRTVYHRQPFSSRHHLAMRKKFCVIFLKGTLRWTHFPDTITSFAEPKAFLF